MKIALSAIMLNEPPEFVERWVKSARDADLLVIADTGSTNDCATAARDLGVVVHDIGVRPWRFDTARNVALSLVPLDVDFVIKMDLDEVLTEGWRDELEDAHASAGAQRYSCDFIWSWTADGQPDVRFDVDHIYSREGWMWRHPVHESLHWVGDGPAPHTRRVAGMGIEHHADNTKSRSQYLPLLARAAAESPDDDRMAHYYARELFFVGDWNASRREFLRHLSLPTATWAPERANSYRYIAKMDDHPERWLLKAVAEDPSRREPWVDLVDLMLTQDRPKMAAGYASRALTIRHRPGDYMTERHAWDDQFLIAASAL